MSVDLQHLQQLHLSTMDNGTIEARFQEELEKVREIMSEAGVQGKASINISLEFKPHKHHGFLEMTTAVSSRIPTQKAANILLMRDGKILEDVTSVSAEQPGMFDRRDESPATNPQEDKHGQ